MGRLTDSLFGVLMSWVRALVTAIWALFSAERMTVLEFLAKNWIGIVVVIVAAGLVIDWLVWLIRWQPYHIWAQRARRVLRIAEPDEEDEQDAAALAAYEAFDDVYMPPQSMGDAEEADVPEEQWMPLDSPVVDEEEAQQVLDAAEQVPDEVLGQYPGMRYDSSAAQQDRLSGTRRLDAVHAEGPGAAEVSRRRAEIDAWQRQMQDEARAKAQAERAAREEEARRAREAQAAYEAEQERLAKEAFEAEQARLAQEAYERELEEYERKREQYERDMAEYERQMAEYEAALAKQQEAAAQSELPSADVHTEFAQENPQPVSAARRRRRNVSYSDMVEGDAAYDLPAAPQWTQMQTAPRIQDSPVQDELNEEKPAKHSLLRSGMAKMAQMMESEGEEITGIASLPPRVDKNAAYRPAKKPGGKKA